MAGYIGSKSSVTLVDGITEEGGTLTGNLSFGDSDKAIFGAGSDLQIFHDGNNSFINELGAGNLTIKSSNVLSLMSGDSEFYATFTANGASTLYHNNSAKLATTSTGIQVTGNIANTSGDLTLDVSGIINLNADNGGNINLKDGGTHYGTIQNENSDLRINSIIQDKDIIFRGNDGGTGINALTLDMSQAGAATFNGKVTASARKTFAPRYENSNSYGSNFAWDRIQLGNNGTNKIIAGNTSAGGSLLFVVNNSVDLVDATTASGTNGINAMKIESSGNVGIGNSIPDSFYAGGNNLVVGSGSGSEGITIYGGAESNLFFGDGTAIADNLRGRIEYSHGIDAMSFYANNAYAMRIDSSGAVAIGDTNPTRHGQTTKTLIYNGSTTTGDFALHVGRVGTGAENQICISNGYGKVGSITTSGTSTAYNTSSDYRLKENVVDLTGASARVNQLNPSRFNFIADGTDRAVDGFLAHEVADVVPEAITGTKDAMKDEEYEVTPAVYEDVITPAVEAVEATYDDEGLVLTEAVEATPETTESVLVTAAVMGTRSVPDYQGIDQSKLVPLLTAALQEALTEIASLKTRVEALEA